MPAHEKPELELAGLEERAKMLRKDYGNELDAPMVLARFFIILLVFEYSLSTVDARRRNIPLIDLAP